MRYKKEYKHSKSRWNLSKWLKYYREKRIPRKNKRLEDEIRESQIRES